MFTNTSDENDASQNGSWIHNVWAISRLGATLEYESPIQFPFEQSIIFINPTSTSIMILSSIPLPQSLFSLIWHCAYKAIVLLCPCSCSLKPSSKLCRSPYLSCDKFPIYFYSLELIQIYKFDKRFLFFACTIVDAFFIS